MSHCLKKCLWLDSCKKCLTVLLRHFKTHKRDSKLSQLSERHKRDCVSNQYWWVRIVSTMLVMLYLVPAVTVISSSVSAALSDSLVWVLFRLVSTPSHCFSSMFELLISDMLASVLLAMLESILLRKSLRSSMLALGRLTWEWVLLMREEDLCVRVRGEREVSGRETGESGTRPESLLLSLLLLVPLLELVWLHPETRDNIRFSNKNFSYITVRLKKRLNIRRDVSLSLSQSFSSILE